MIYGCHYRDIDLVFDYFRKLNLHLASMNLSDGEVLEMMNAVLRSRMNRDANMDEVIDIVVLFWYQGHPSVHQTQSHLALQNHICTDRQQGNERMMIYNAARELVGMPVRISLILYYVFDLLPTNP